MTRTRSAIFAASVFFLMSSLAFGQLDKMVIPAGTPEDKDLTLIGNEPDGQKRIAMYQDFLQKYASNPVAEAYASWQLSQSNQQAGDLQKAAEYGEKAATLAPHSLEILEWDVTLAQQTKDTARAFKYAIQGGQAYVSIDKAPKPADVTDADFASTIASEKEASQEAYTFFETSAYNAIVSETDAKTRVNDIDQFTTAFPNSKLQEQTASMAMLALSELKDTHRLNEYAEKALAANPNNLAALLSLANSYLDSAEPAKAIPYAQRAVVAAKADDPAADRAHKVSAGVAHSILGRVYAKQQKTQAAIAELKSAVALLRGQDDQQFALAAYYLGWEYAKVNALTEARGVLAEAAGIPGSAQQPARELLAKVNAARAAGH
jgi:tetratricopeptide (TPR) repeat protein